MYEMRKKIREEKMEHAKEVQRAKKNRREERALNT